jgi:hypothetical protein
LHQKGASTASQPNLADARSAETTQQGSNVGEGNRRRDQRKLFRDPRDDQFQLSRGWKLKVLRLAQLPAGDGKVSKSAMHKVLLALDDFAGNGRTCCVGQRRIADWGRLSARQVRSALRVLEAAGLVATELRNSRRGRVANRFVLQWQALVALAPGMEWPSSGPGPETAGADRRPAAELAAGLAVSPHSFLPGAQRQVSPGAPESLAGPAESLAGDLTRLSNRLYEPPPPPSPPATAGLRGQTASADVRAELDCSSPPEARSDRVALPKAPAAPWAEAEEDLIRLGLGEHGAAIAACREAGCQPAFVRAAVELYQSRPGWWLSAGAVFHRLKLARPDQDPTDLRFWPAPDPAAKRRFELEAIADTRREETSREIDRREELEARLQDDDERLAGLSAEQLDQLIDRSLDDFARQSCRNALRRLGRTGLRLYAPSLIKGLDRSDAERS